MKKEGKLLWRERLFTGMLALVLAVCLGMFADVFSTVSRADSQGKVTASSAKIRSEASTSSTAVGGALRDEIVTITGQVDGSDGKVWYAVTTSSQVSGYIRSDLIQLLDGSQAAATPKPTAVPETPAQVTEVNPISATVTGGTTIRIRSNASTTSQILTTVSSGLALTVTGQADGSDGKVWYRVNFISNNSEINGFIRSDFVTLSGELVPASEATPEPGDTSEPEVTPEPETTPEPEKAYDTILKDGKWWVYDTSTNNGWVIQEMVDSSTQNAELYLESQKTVKSQKGVIIVLVILLVGAGAGIALLVFKVKDMSDSAYFNAVESETIKRRSAASQAGGQKVMHTVGAEKKPGTGQGQRPAGAAPQGQRPAGTAPQGQRPAGGAAPQGQRPAGGAAPQGQRPAGAAPQGQRPAGGAAPQGQRPAGTAPQGQRPAGATPQGQRPAGGAAPQGQRPAGGAAPQGQRPAGGAAPQEQRPAGAASQGQRPAGAAQEQNPGRQSQSWQSKNFMADDEEEFDFEFLDADSADRDK